MFSRRLKVSLISGAILGIFCIIGALIRFDFQISTYLVFSLWYNRIIMGLVIGLALQPQKISKAIGRGAFLGLLISFAYYSSTGFNDFVSFFAGIIYGMIIEYISYRFAANEK
jgi:hypothetical protein